MKLLIFSGIFLVTVLASANEAQIGIVLGSTTGISGKVDIGGNRSIEGVLAYSTDSQYGNYFHVDYLIEKARNFAVGNVSPVYLYYGPGIRLINIRTGVDSGKTKIGFRGPIGVNTHTSNPDLELFGEIAPTADLTPSTSVYLEVGIGIRFRF